MRKTCLKSTIMTQGQCTNFSNKDMKRMSSSSLTEIGEKKMKTMC